MSQVKHSHILNLNLQQYIPVYAAGRVLFEDMAVCLHRPLKGRIWCRIQRTKWNKAFEHALKFSDNTDRIKKRNPYGSYGCQSVTSHQIKVTQDFEFHTEPPGRP